MHFRHLAFAVACVSVAFTGHALSISIPVPPEGWEERVTPGYNPSVEQVVVGNSGIGASARAAWHYWDEGAVDVLLRLLDDEQWRGFRESIIRTLGASPYPRAIDCIHSKIIGSLPRNELPEQDTFVFNWLTLLEFGLYGVDRREACIALCLASGNDKAMEKAIERLINMRTPDAHARAGEAIGRVGDEKLRASLTHKFKTGRGYLRAMEPVHPHLGEPESPAEESIAEEVPISRPFITSDPANATIAGHVRDAFGNPMSAHITVFYEGSSYSYISVEDGAFTAKWLPPGPFFLDVMKRGYQARLLASGRDFSTGDGDLVIELAVGPYEDTAPVWMQAAGFRSEDDALQFPNMAQYARRRAGEYQRFANMIPIAPQHYVLPANYPRVPIRVNDAGGQPVQRITVQAAEKVGGNDVPLSFHTSRPAHGSVPETMASESGEYTVPTPCLVDAEGFARQVVNACAPSLIEVRLTQPARLVVEVRDYHGEPVEGARALPTDWIQELDWNNPFVSPKADTQGCIVLAGLPEGFHGYAVALRGPSEGIPDRDYRPWPPRFIAADLRAGEETVVRVTLPIARRDTVESVLLDWELRYPQGPDRRPILDEEVPALGWSKKRRMGALIAAQLAQMPRVCRLNQNEVIFFSTLAPLLGKHAGDAKAGLQRLLAGMAPEPSPDRVSHVWVEKMVEALLALGGDRDIAYWAEVVGKPGVSPVARLHASAMLGRIGTEESTGAWLALLDAARGASSPENRRTHADLMTEAVLLAATGSVSPADEWQETPDSAWVDEEYETGTMSYGDHTVSVRRHGDEWIITGITTRNYGP